MMLTGKPWQIIHGDVRRVCKTLPENYFDAALTDPPYGLSFMGRKWDYAVPSAMVWLEILRTLKPGAHGMVFGGPRTFHRVAVAVEDGGFIPRDLLLWMFGQGMPKSQDTSKAIDKKAGAKREVVGTRKQRANGSGSSVPFNASVSEVEEITAPATADAEEWEGYGSGLKPGYEPIILARKMLDGTIVDNALKWGAGPLAIDMSRIEGEGAGTRCTNRDENGRCLGHRNAGRSTSGETIHGPDTVEVGRWPSNVILDEEVAAMLDEQSGIRPGMSGGGKHRPNARKGMFGAIDSTTTARGDTGGASRFYYTAKADRYQREAGLNSFKKKKKRPHKYGSIQDGRSSSGDDYDRGLDCDEIVLYAPKEWVNAVLDQMLPVATVRSLRKATEESTIRTKDGLVWSMCWCGNPRTDPFHPVMKSIIETKTNSTIDSATWCSSHRQHTRGCIADVFGKMVSGESLAESVGSTSPWMQHTGISAPKAGHNTDGVDLATSVASWLTSKQGESDDGVSVRNTHPT